MHRRQRVEQGIHKAIVGHLKARGVPGLVYLHPANGGYRRRAEASVLAGLGVVKGAPDLLLWCDGQSFAMEIKSETGRTSPAQLEMLNRLSQAGVFTAVTHSLNQAIGVLESWQLLKRTVQ